MMLDIFLGILAAKALWDWYRELRNRYHICRMYNELPKEPRIIGTNEEPFRRS